MPVMIAVKIATQPQYTPESRSEKMAESVPFAMIPLTPAWT